MKDNNFLQNEERLNVTISDTSSVCSNMQESQRLTKFFELLLKIDKDIKKRNEESSK